MVPEPCVEHALNFLSCPQPPVCLFVGFCPWFIPSGRAGVGTAVGDRRGFGGHPVWGIKLCVARGGGASRRLKHRQAPDVRPTTEGDKSKQIGQDCVIMGKTCRLCLE